MKGADKDCLYHCLGWIFRGCNGCLTCDIHLTTIPGRYPGVNPDKNIYLISTVLKLLNSTSRQDLSKLSWKTIQQRVVTLVGSAIHTFKIPDTSYLRARSLLKEDYPDG